MLVLSNTFQFSQSVIQVYWMTKAILLDTVTDNNK